MADEEHKVVSIRGEPVGDGPQVDERLIEVLESLLRDAKTGQLTSLAAATVWAGHGCATAFHVGKVDSCVVLMGSVTRLVYNLNHMMDDRERDL